MTPEDYLQKQKDIKDTYLADLQILAKEYATINNMVKVGDVLTSTVSNMMRVESIVFFYPVGDLPYCSYYGSWLTKKGEQRNKECFIQVSQYNIKAINGVEV